MTFNCINTLYNEWDIFLGKNLQFINTCISIFKLIDFDLLYRTLHKKPKDYISLEAKSALYSNQIWKFG